MIKRTWRAWTTKEVADRYETLLRKEVFPEIEAKGGDGFRGIELLRRDGPQEVEFLTIMTFESIDSVRDFAGEDYLDAYVPASARALFIRCDERSRHYEVREERSL